MTENPYESKTVNGDEAVQLIDSMRANGSFEDARERLNNSARVIGERITAAVPGQTWRFDDDPHGVKAARNGALCEKLHADVARRPRADPVVFGRTFSAEEFATAADIVREEAAQYGATDDSSLFNEQAKRDFDLQGNGYEFNLGQINFATLTITGDCFLLQTVLDLPPGQLPPEPPILPTTPSPTP
ncbi:hypothetical protein MDOR_33630 [Mycolicibacterium doricum]|uniref:Lipoprotein LppA n=1 Tax=Mycolicibacterium doricum TaxID=126673 RepID=A0A7I7VV79_9MYCO|nr:hypothetical protein MDOR_33630 [Mycolicibacterium doricum]